MNKMWLGVLALIIIVGAGGAYVMRHQIKTALMPATPTPTVEVMQQAEASPSPASTSAMTAQEFTVSGNEYAFSPAKLTVKANEPVTITFKNTGTFPHNLTIADLSAGSKTIQPGESNTFTFTPTQTGSFKFTCTVPGHADKGMVGTLTVQ